MSQQAFFAPQSMFWQEATLCVCPQTFPLKIIKIFLLGFIV
jgi:hypothetical protein